MGLAGRKTKQRIPNDPRNLAWANDASKFGAAYLTKLGWDPSRGLGVSGEGRTNALSVHQKLDMLGIGADHKNSPEGLAWKQNREFENLLRRLNAANGNGEAEESGEPMKIDGFVRPTPASAPAEERGEDAAEGLEEEGKGEVKQGVDKKSKKKRKKDENDGEDEERKKRKKLKSKSSDDHSASEGGKTKKERKRVVEEASSASASEPATSAPSPVSFGKSAPSRNPRAFFRARHMAAKNIASKSASSIAEVLGFSPTPSASAYPSSAPTPCPSTPFEASPSTSSSSEPSGPATPSEDLKLQELSISSKSVMDYFKEKLAAKSNARVFASTSSSATTPVADEDADDYDERPRIGLGASKLRNEITREAEAVEVEERRGLGGSSMRTSFAAMFTANTAASSRASLEVPVFEKDMVKTKDRGEKERRKEKKKEEKGKEKAVADEDLATDATAVREEVDEKEARRRRKEEKRRRKESKAQAQANMLAIADEEGIDAGSDSAGKERKRKEKRKSKADRQ